MPNIKSAKKRVETTERNRLRNVAIKSTVKTAMRKLYDAIKAGDDAVIAESLNKVYSTVDKATSKGAFHQNTAARKKSRATDHAAKKTLPASIKN